MPSRKPKLTEHLRQYGIRYFSDDQYWSWGGEQLGERRGERLNRLRKPLQEARATREDLRAFYDFISDSKIGAVVHSMKADAIRASGEAIEEHIRDRARILDVGCGLGYLTTWYACVNRVCHVVGVDILEKSVRQARRLAGRLGVRNVEFQVADFTESVPSGTYEAIVDSQSLSSIFSYSPDALARGLTNLRGVLEPNGILVSISAIGDSKAAQEFIEILYKSGFGIQAFEFIFHSDLNEPAAYPIIVASPGIPSVDLNLEEAYQRAAQEVIRRR
ncbi:MAG: class I SAM-dependent methyltransferase [Nitrospiraceae bacterium]|nr:MAG: class I SAM-dependent methyltransferase [Nitrospiraceae bacterium]